MTAQEHQQLAGECAEFADLTARAQAWVEDPDNVELVGAEAKSLVQMMRRNARRARRLARAAQTKGDRALVRALEAGAFETGA